MLLTAKEAVEQCGIGKYELTQYNVKPIIKKVGNRILYDKDKLESAISHKHKESENHTYMYNGEKVVFISQIASVHRKSKSAISNIMRSNNMEKGNDYYFIEPEKIKSIVGYERRRSNSLGLNMITKRGYMKMFHGELNAEWFRQLFNEDVNLSMNDYDNESNTRSLYEPMIVCNQETHTLSDISKISGASIKKIENKFHNNKNKLIKNKDYYKLSEKELKNINPKIKTHGNSGMNFITKSGCKKLYGDLLGDEMEKMFHENVYPESDELITNRKYYRGIRYVTASDIAKEHNISPQCVNGKYSVVRKNMIEGVDFIRMSARECEELGLANHRSRPSGMYVYTASGYKKIFEYEFNKIHFNNLFGEDENQTPLNIEETESKIHENDDCIATLESNDKINTINRKDGRVEKRFSYGGKRYYAYGHDEAEALVKMSAMIAKLAHAELSDDDNIHELINVLVDEHKTFKDILEKQSAQLDIMQQILSAVLNNNPSDSELVEKVEVKNETENQENDLKLSSPTTTKEWYDDINRLLTEIKGYSDLDKNVILSEAYKRLNGQYGICLEQYRKEYQGIVGKKPNMLSTICWVENEKNPITHGLLAGVMDSMLSEAKGNDKKLREIAMV